MIENTDHKFFEEELVETTGLFVPQLLLQGHTHDEQIRHHRRSLGDTPPLDLENEDSRNDGGAHMEKGDAEFVGDLNKRKRRKKADKSQFQREINAGKRMKGDSYLGRKVTTLESNGIKAQKTHLVVKPAREMGKTCNSSQCQKSKFRNCRSFTQTDRELIFKSFWRKDWNEKRGYVGSLVDIIPKKTTKSKTNTCTRNFSYLYFLKLHSCRIQVCREMFLSTLGVNKMQVKNWVNKSDNVRSPKSDISSRTTKNSSNLVRDSCITEFFQSLPKMPSHYCRSSSSKLYLEPIINSKFQLFKLYKEFCKNKNQIPFSRWKFEKTFFDQNLSLFLPKKDQCDLCVGHSAGNISAEIYTSHLKNKDLARESKSKDKQSSIEGKCHALVMDVQSVKLSPVLSASAVYYKTKLMVHNYTVYDLKSRDVTCYWWDESEAEIVASTFASCLLEYIQDHFGQDNLPVIIYSDGCTNQNRNVMLSNALLDLSIRQKRIIYQKYLEKGHTQMECDSVHSAIEAKLKNRTIYAPQDYVGISIGSRSPPYTVKYLDFNFFSDFSEKSCQRYLSIRPGNKTGDSCVTDIRQIKYDNGKIYYKLGYEVDLDWTEIPQRYYSREDVCYPKLYNCRQKITARKYKDLQDLKAVIPSEFHSFYDNLPHK